MASAQDPAATSPELGSQLRKPRFRTRLTAGLITILPIWITFLLVGFVFRIMRDASLWIVEALLASNWTLPLLREVGVSVAEIEAHGIDALPVGLRWALASFSVLLTILSLYALGVVTTHFVGRRIMHGVDSVFDRVPFIATVYRASKQVLSTFTGETAQSFQRVVLVPFPSKGVHTVGFVTSLREDASGEPLATVFVATAPNPTTGFVLIVKRSDLIELDWTVEEAIKTIMSGGVLAPDSLGAAPPSTSIVEVPNPVPTGR